MKIGIREKILLPTLAILLVGMTTIVTLNYVLSHRSVDASVRDEVGRTARLVAVQLDGWLEERVGNVETWAGLSEFVAAVRPTSDGAAREAAGILAERLVKNYGYYETVNVVRLDGSYAASSNAEMVGKLNVSDRAYFAEASAGHFHLSDVLVSKVSGNPIFVIATPIRDETGTVIGVLSGSVALNIFTAKAITPIKIYNTGYVFVTDHAGVMLAHPKNENILKLDVSKLDWGPAFLDGKSTAIEYTFGGEQKMTGIAGVERTGWFVGATAPVGELTASVDHLGFINAGIGIAALVVASALVAFVLVRVLRPLKRGMVFTEKIAQGDLTQSLEAAGSDEIAHLARAMNQMAAGLRVTMGTVTENAQALSAASTELSAVSTQVSSNSEETSAQANVVASAAEQVSKSVATVATAAEEMSASIKEIAQQASEAAKVAAHAAGVAKATNGTIISLGHSSTEIGKVIKVITTIAEQTNLLALNATIEAARAGDAGKGFAVVAGEVKELAKQTARATDEIRGKIEAIQGETNSAVAAITEIAGVIGRINQIQTSIASSVEEQAATMNEISSNSHEASTGSAEIAKNISSVSEAARSSTEAATSTAASATELSRLAEQLTTVVGQFKVETDRELPAIDPEIRPLVAFHRSQDRAGDKARSMRSRLSPGAR